MKDLNRIAIAVAAEDGLSLRAAQIFKEELALRAGAEVGIVAAVPTDAYTFIIGEWPSLAARFPAEAEAVAALPPAGAEGFRIAVGDVHTVIAGSDGRGCLYGIAHVLRKLYLKPGRVALTEELTDLSLTPAYPLRGHQLAYRDKQNTCPAWDEADFDRYIRDLLLFGSNAIEILPPRTDDTLYSPLFQKDPLEMMAKLSEIIHSYGMDVWVWYPNMGERYEDPDARAEELSEREKVFSAVPYIDAVLIPAGDPGDLLPKLLFPVVGESVAVLRRHHPNATVWLAPQVFAPIPTWHEDFYQELSKEPEWLYGLCFAPWMYETLPEFYNKVPEKYRVRIRHYPDITHNSSSQFELPDWDLPFALFNARESYNARPRAMKHIHNLHAPFTCGSLTYCEGIHDDINKMIWGDQDFCPSREVTETVRDYVRLFIDPDLIDELSALILSFEDSWVGYARENTNIDRVFDAFRALDKRVDDRIRDNYRFKMAYLRAIADYQAKHRSIYDASLEALAYDALRKAPTVGADAAMRDAHDALNLTFIEPVNDDLNVLMLKMADELRKTPGCRIQLTTKYHGGQSWIRGAFLDAVRMPLNDHQWLTQHFRRIRALSTEAEKLAAIDRLVHWRDPGDGGQYCCLGDLNDFKRHVLPRHTWAEDPGFLRSPVINSDPYGLQFVFHHNRGWHTEYPIAMNWIRRARVIYGTPLDVHFGGLEPGARYTLRVAYPDCLLATQRSGIADTETMEVKLYAGGRLVHDRIGYYPPAKAEPIFEYALPPEATEGGELLLTWQVYGRLDRFSVSEIWLVRTDVPGKEVVA